MNRIMLKMLLRLWWLQQRRNFHKRDAVVAAYLLFLYVAMGVGFFKSFTENGGSFTDDDMPALFGAGIVIGLLICDIIMKLVMKKDMTAMDDYVKSRPVPEGMWNRFLLVSNLLSFWNYVLPVITIPVFVYMFGIPMAAVCFLLFLAFSLVNGIYITCFRKAPDLMLKWPLVLGWIGMYALLIGYMFVAAFFPVWMGYAGLFVLAGAVFAGLVVYLFNLKNYNEQKRKVSRFRAFRDVNLFSLQYIGTMRAKRVRNMVLVVSLIFLFDAYLFAFLPVETAEQAAEMHRNIIFYVAGCILLPSICLSQWTFGIEANFFQGLMTKPVKIEQMLQNCFYYYVIVSAIALVFTVPFLFLNVGVSGWTLLGSFCLAVFINLFNLPTCLFSTRLEIFNTSMFSMQGANMKINLYAIAFLVPLGILVLIYKYVGEMAWCITSIALAVIAVLIHKWAIAKLATIFYNRRYKRMEKFMEV